MFKKIVKSKLGLLGLLIVGFMGLLAIGAPFITQYDPSAINVEEALSPPSLKHPLGTDSLGRDLFSRIAYGARISMSVGFVAVGVAIIIGIIVGSISGFFGGLVDEIIMRFVDIMLCFPSFFLILTLVAIITRPSIYLIMIIIGLTSWMGSARLIRAEILSLKEQNFILALKVLRIPTPRIIFRHLVPNAISPVLVNATLGIAAAILVEASLSFLGLGVQPPTPSWGNILMEAKSTLGVAWWITLFPGLCILFTVLGFNLVGEAIREQFK